MWKGLLELRMNKCGIKAYEMYKNAERLGYTPMAYRALGQIFMTPDLKDVIANMKVADRYFNKAKELGMDIRNAP